MDILKILGLALVALAVFVVTIGGIIYASANRSEIAARTAFTESYESELRLELASSYSDQECYNEDTTMRCVRIRSLYCQLDIDPSVDSMLRCGEAERIQELTGTGNRELEILQGQEQ